jgi:hypothetical protein
VAIEFKGAMMKKTILAITFLSFAVSWSGGAAAESMFKVSAQVRHRFEASDTDFDTKTAYNTFNLLRTRLGVHLTPTDDVTGFIQLQDSRWFGQETSTLLDGDANTFDLHQGYLEIHDFFKAPLDVKLGRMEVNYGFQRLVGAVGWNNIGRAFDGLILNLHSERLSVDVFEMVVADSLFVGDFKDEYFYGLHADIKVRESHTTNVFAFWQRKQPRSLLNRITIGAFLEGSLGGFSYQSDLGYQFGDITTFAADSLITGDGFADTTQSVEAYMVTLRLGYTAADVKMAPAIFAAVDYLSGDDNLNDDAYKVFDTMYGTNHRFYGFMDFFLNLPPDTYFRGLVDLWGRLRATPLGRTPMMLDVHYFQSQQNVVLSDLSESKNFGTEVDFTLRHVYDPNITFTLGASWFGPGDIFKDKKGADSSTWFYAMTMFKI